MPLSLSLSCLMVPNVPYNLLNVNGIKQQMFSWSLASDALTLYAQDFLQNVQGCLWQSPNQTCSNGSSVITTDFKVTNNILTATLSFYMHSTKLLLEQELYIFPRSITIHPKTQATIIIKWEGSTTSHVLWFQYWKTHQLVKWLYTHMQPFGLERVNTATYFFSISIVTLTMLP